RASLRHHLFSLATHLCAPHLTLFFSTDAATTEISTLSLHDALPISRTARTFSSCRRRSRQPRRRRTLSTARSRARIPPRLTKSRSEEHTSELQSRFDLVCRLLLEKKKNTPMQPESATASCGR